MKHFSFVASDTIESDFLNDLEARFAFQETIVLDSKLELEVLLNLLGLSLSPIKLTRIDDVDGAWLLQGKLTDYNDSEFDELYQQWLSETKRDNNMDEYGQLLFLSGFSEKFNSARYRIVLSEAI